MYTSKRVFTSHGAFAYAWNTDIHEPLPPPNTSGFGFVNDLMPLLNSIAHLCSCKQYTMIHDSTASSFDLANGLPMLLAHLLEYLHDLASRTLCEHSQIHRIGFGFMNGLLALLSFSPWVPSRLGFANVTQSFTSPPRWDFASWTASWSSKTLAIFSAMRWRQWWCIHPWLQSDACIVISSSPLWPHGSLVSIRIDIEPLMATSWYHSSSSCNWTLPCIASDCCSTSDYCCLMPADPCWNWCCQDVEDCHRKKFLPALTSHKRIHTPKNAGLSVVSNDVTMSWDMIRQLVSKSQSLWR